MTPALRRAAERALGARVIRAVYLQGGSAGEVWRLFLEDGRDAAAKTRAAGLDGDGPPVDFRVEARMLARLRRDTPLPAPRALWASADLLLLDYVEADGGPLSPAGVEEAAAWVAAMHGRAAADFGYPEDGAIGPLPQPNGWMGAWVDFLRDRRLLFMGRLARRRGGLRADALRRLERLCEKLDRILTHSPAPGLIHGDLWGGNVLARGGRVAAVIDPALHWADPEMELAYISLFSAFGPDFFDRYAARRPIDRDFFTDRRPVYQLYPLLVHAAIYGGDWGARADAILRRYVD